MHKAFVEDYLGDYNWAGPI